MLIPHPTPPIELTRGTLTARSRSLARLPRPFSPSSTTSPRTPPRASARPPASRRGSPPAARVRWLRPRRLLPRLRLLYKDINAGGTVPWCNPGVAVTVTSVTHGCCASFQSHRRAMALSCRMPHRRMRAERRIDRRCIDCRRRSAQWRIPIRAVKPDSPHHLQGPLLRKVGVIGNLVHSSPNIKKEVLNAGALQPVIGLLRSDLLGQVMPLVGRDWSQSSVARLFSATKENGYQLMFLSARAIVQAFLTKASSST